MEYAHDPAINTKRYIFFNKKKTHKIVKNLLNVEIYYFHNATDSKVFSIFYRKTYVS